jgi:hypothetical protein
MAKQNLTLDITATMGHPDICSVAEWLVEQGFIADWSENLDQFLPYDGEGDMIDYVWAHVGTRVLVDTCNGPVTCKVLVSPDSKVMEVLADTDSDSAVADIYKYFVSRLSDKFDIQETPDLKDTLDGLGIDPLAKDDTKEAGQSESIQEKCIKMLTSIPLTEDLDRLSAEILYSSFGNDVVSLSEQSFSFQEHDLSHHDTNFTLFGKNFILRFTNSMGIHVVEVGLDLEDTPFPENAVVVNNIEHLGEVILANFFNFEEKVRIMTGGKIDIKSARIDNYNTIVYTGTYGNLKAEVFVKPTTKLVQVELFDGDKSIGDSPVVHLGESLEDDLATIVSSTKDENEPKEEEKCPFCSGGSPDCDSEVLHMERDEGDFANIFNEGKYMGTFHWKFCPLCAKPLA